MSGHSKWKNIMHRKAGSDAKRAKAFTKIGREIAVVIREGGPDPASNTRLKDAIAKAKANNVPNDNINRLIARYSSGGDGASYEALNYEGYGPAGIALIVEALTDNKNRTAGDLRHYFDKYGGNLGATGCVSWQFEKKGVIIIERDGISEDAALSDALDCGAADFKTHDEIFEIFMDADDFTSVREALEDKGYTFAQAEIELVPQTYVSLSDPEQLKLMRKLLDALDDNDDVQNVWHNWDETE